jgi:hypothetical protein
MFIRDFTYYFLSGLVDAAAPNSTIIPTYTTTALERKSTPALGQSQTITYGWASPAVS